MKINNKFTSLAAGAVLLAGTTTAAVVSTTQPANAAVWLNARVCTPNLVNCWTQSVWSNNFAAIACQNNFRWPVFVKTAPWNNNFIYSHCL